MGWEGESRSHLGRVLGGRSENKSRITPPCIRSPPPVIPCFPTYHVYIPKRSPPRFPSGGAVSGNRRRLKFADCRNPLSAHLRTGETDQPFRTVREHTENLGLSVALVGTKQLEPIRTGPTALNFIRGENACYGPSGISAASLPYNMASFHGVISSFNWRTSRLRQPAPASRIGSTHPRKSCRLQIELAVHRA